MSEHTSEQVAGLISEQLLEYVAEHGRTHVRVDIDHMSWHMSDFTAGH